MSGEWKCKGEWAVLPCRYCGSSEQTYMSFSGYSQIRCEGCFVHGPVDDDGGRSAKEEWDAMQRGETRIGR